MSFSCGIALLRGINVGRAKRIAMADLRTLFEELGFTGVRTVLNSGNVVFGSPALTPAAAAKAIEDALVERIGVVSRVTVLSAHELAAVVAGNRLVGLSTDHARLVTFIVSGEEQRELLARLAPLATQDWAPGALAIGERAAYVWCPTGVLDSAAAAAVGKLLGDATTARNWNTLCKLHALCAQASQANRAN
ncbi:MAG: hypothetical protein JWR40_1514 [Massilia sp.]|jgi:uncharacterized protein (DUF1697 family)|nr:hypothetical protein [Massilia sp.]MDB5951249.1 hypothetical protein [Massilia sp.]